MFCIAASLDYVEITNPQVTVKVGEKVEVVCNTVAQYKKFTLQWETIGEFYGGFQSGREYTYDCFWCMALL